MHINIVNVTHLPSASSQLVGSRPSSSRNDRRDERNLMKAEGESWNRNGRRSLISYFIHGRS